MAEKGYFPGERFLTHVAFAGLNLYDKQNIAQPGLDATRRTTPKVIGKLGGPGSLAKAGAETLRIFHAGVNKPNSRVTKMISRLPEGMQKTARDSAAKIRAAVFPVEYALVVGGAARLVRRLHHNEESQYDTASY